MLYKRKPTAFAITLAVAGILSAGWIRATPAAADEGGWLKPYQLELLEQGVSPADFTSGTPGTDPFGTHLSWTASEGSRSMAVTWLTAGGTNPNQVQYGLTGAYELGTVSATETAGPFGAAIHTAVISGLSPNVEYHYSVSPDGAGSWSPDRTFTTAPAGRSAMTFLAAGDSRQVLPYPLGNLNPWSDLAVDMSSEDALFTVFTGDAVHDAVVTQHWWNWFEVSEPLSGTSPLLPCLGNHEISGDTDAAKYSSYFALPQDAGTERWYSCDIGRVHVVTLDSELTADAGQIAWLTQDLAQASKTSDWIVVNYHRPGYTSGSGDTHGGNSWVQDLWVPIFDDYHVDLVFNGHNHFYQRTFPIYGGLVPSNPTVVDSDPSTYDNPDGTVYVITGAAGAPTLINPFINYQADDNEPYIAAYVNYTEHYMRITLDGKGTLHAEAISTDGVILDEFWIIKSLSTMQGTYMLLLGDS